MSYPVVVGYTSAAAIIIVGSQLQSLVGSTVDHVNVFSLVYQLLSPDNHWNSCTVAVSAISMFFILVSTRLIPKLPTALIVLVMGMLLSGLFQIEQYGVVVISYIPQGIPQLNFPSVNGRQLINCFHWQ